MIIRENERVEKCVRCHLKLPAFLLPYFYSKSTQPEGYLLYGQTFWFMLTLKPRQAVCALAEL